MRKLLFGLWLSALLVTPAFADLEKFFTLTLQNAAVATGNGNELPVDQYTAVGLQVTIVTTATVTFETTADGTTYVSAVCSSVADTTGALVSTATASGVFQCNVAGMSKFRARISAWTSGAVTVTARATTAVLGKSGSGGGISEGALFPVGATSGTKFVLTSDSAVGDCVEGGGSAITFCRYNGSNWVKLGDGTAAGGALSAGDIDTCAELAAIMAGETGTCGSLVFSQAPTITSAVLVTPALGTPASGTLTNTTGFPTANLAGLGANVAAMLASMTSANVAAAVTNETGTSLLVFNTNPLIVTPTFTGALTFEDGVRQTFNPNTTTAGFNVGATTTDPSSANNGDEYYDSGTDKFRCHQAGAWVDCIAASGGSSAFSALTSSTNTTATMLVGSGASLATTGSGTITASAVTANAVALTTGTTGNYVASATASGGLTMTGTEGGSLGMTPCAENEIPKFVSSAWTCAADSTGGTPSFDAITTGSNTTATMTVGAGGSVVPASTGVIAATAIRQKVVTVNAGNSPYTGLATDFLFLCDTSAAGRTITLPAATTKNVFHVKNLGANSCTINRAGSDTIDGGTSAVLTVADESISLESDGSAEWQIF